MVTVAKGFNAPIKILFPRNIVEIIQTGSFFDPGETRMSMVYYRDCLVGTWGYSDSGNFHCALFKV